MCSWRREDKPLRLPGVDQSSAVTGGRARDNHGTGMILPEKPRLDTVGYVVRSPIPLDPDFPAVPPQLQERRLEVPCLILVHAAWSRAPLVVRTHERDAGGFTVIPLDPRMQSAVRCTDQPGSQVLPVHGAHCPSRSRQLKRRRISDASLSSTITSGERKVTHQL